MKKSFFILAFCTTLIASSVTAKNSGTINLEEAKNAFEYLNRVRQNPKNYSKEIGGFMRSIKPMPALIWNDTLARVAQEKALDMANKNYFAHINKSGQGINILIHQAGYTLEKEFIKNKKNNFFESLAMGQDNGVEVINELILDKVVNPPSHRQHLLGLTDFWASCLDIGIGFVTTDNPQIPTYTCIIIARHR
ncbi:MAG: CAP domain-containing protein [Paludibacteraceae bacterium]|nr:CAP domain-containing protein [Paludibacteraceae bacterium]